MTDEKLDQAVESQTTESVANDKAAEKYGVDYMAEQLANVKKNTVSKEEFDKLASQNRDLIQKLLNGSMIEDEQEIQEDPEKIKNLRKELFKLDNSMSNLEYAKKTLELRNECLKRGEPDPFLPWGKRISPTQLDIEAANRVANVMQECIDRSDGDSQLFTNELMRRTNDVHYK